MARFAYLGLLGPMLYGCASLTEGVGGVGESESTGEAGTTSASGTTAPAGTTAADGTATSTTAATSTTTGTSTDPSDATADPTAATDPTTSESGDDTSTSTGPVTVCGDAGDCDDGMYCNGSEDCDPERSPRADGCVPAGDDPCEEGDFCAEDAQECIESRRIFISSGRYNGDLGGAAGADALCQGLAATAGLPNDWRAFIVDTNTSLARHTQRPVPYETMDGDRIADDWADLTDESIQSRIDRNENDVASTGNVWTGFINVVGDLGGDNDCSDWTTSAVGCLAGGPCGGAGESSLINNHWDGFHVYFCSQQYALYCVEQ